MIDSSTPPRSTLLETNIEPLCAAIGPLAGTTLRYIHTDSWEGGGMNWTPGFDRTFREHRGYDLIPWLAVLAGHVVDSREDSNAFLADFRKTIGDLVANHYAASPNWPRPAAWPPTRNAPAPMPDRWTA